MTVTIFSVLTAAIFIFNVILAAALVLLFIPILGFFIYLFLGRQLRKKTLFKWEGSKRVGIEHLIATQMNELHDNSFEFQDPNAKNYTDLVYLHLRNNGALLTQDNNLQIFNDGRKSSIRFFRISKMPLITSISNIIFSVWTNWATEL